MLTTKLIGDLVVGCKKNDRRSQKYVFEYFKEYAATICYRYANNTNDIKDLVSDGFIRVFVNMQQYDEQKFGITEPAFKGWIKRVLINNCINYLKKHNYKFEEITENTAQNYSTNRYNESIVSSISYNEILIKVNDLPNAYKTVFNLFAIDGYTHEEIAEMLNISVGTSKSNLFKARKILKTELINY